MRAWDGATGQRRRRLRGLILKETLQILRDPSSILIAGVLPLVLLFLFGYGVSLDADQLSVGLVLEDDSPAATSLARSFVNTPYFDADIGRHRAEFRRGLTSGRYRGLIVVGRNFAENLHGPGRSALQVLTDGSQPNTAGFVANYAQGVVRAWMDQQNVIRGSDNAAGIRLEQRVWYNPRLDSRASLVPGSVVLVMTLIGTLLTALVIAREWERGTMEAMMATPVGIGEILAGKLVPYYVLGMGSMLLCVGIAVFVFGVPFQGSLPALILVSTVFLLPMLSFGLFISTAAKSQFVASQIALMSAFLPAMFLSGFIFEISSMPLPVRLITYVVPPRYFVTALTTLMLVGDVWRVLLQNMAALTLLGLLLFAALRGKIKKRLD
jgi:ABC-2 type transport system permease protein